MILILLMPLALYGIYEKIRLKTGKGSAALAGALLCYEGFIALLANILSIGSSLNAMTASAAWLILDLLLFTFPRDSKQDGILLPMLKKRGRQIKEGITSLPGKFRELNASLSPWEKALCLLSIALCLILLFLALFNVPYNYDSQTYHLARIAHWIDNGSVNYYLTNIDRQLYSPVLSEYNLLFMLLLGGSDLLLHLHQYAAMLASAYFIFVILQKLGTKRLFCFFGVFVYLTMPLTMSQAITTQNDLCAALWYLIFLYYVLCFLETPPLQRAAGIHIAADKSKTSRQCPGSLMILYVCIGASVGFAFLMKPSVCASMVMFLPWVLVMCLRKKEKFITLIKAGITALLSMCIVISETLIRTYLACGSFISSTTGGDIMVATKNVRYILVNILKNYSLLITQHFITDLNGFIYRIAISAGRILQVEVNNEAIAFHGFDFITYLNTGLDMYSHDRTSSSFAAYLSLLGGLLLVLSLVAAFFRFLRNQARTDAAKSNTTKIDAARNNKPANATTKQMSDTSKNSTPISYGFVISAWLGFGFIMALLRWQPWGSRLMYPALTVATVASVHILGQLLSMTQKPSKSYHEQKNDSSEQAGTSGKPASVLRQIDRVSIQSAQPKFGFATVTLAILTVLTILLAIKPLADNSQVALSYLASGFDKTKKEALMFESHKHSYDSYIQLMEQMEKPIRRISPL